MVILPHVSGIICVYFLLGLKKNNASDHHSSVTGTQQKIYVENVFGYARKEDWEKIARSEICPWRIIRTVKSAKGGFIQ